MIFTPHPIPSDGFSSITSRSVCGLGSGSLTQLMLPRAGREPKTNELFCSTKHERDKLKTVGARERQPGDCKFVPRAASCCAAPKRRRSVRHARASKTRKCIRAGKKMSPTRCGGQAPGISCPRAARRSKGYGSAPGGESGRRPHAMTHRPSAPISD